MNGIIYWIFAIIFVAIGSYIIGIKRGYSTYSTEYDRGYNDALNWCHKNYEMTDISEKMDNIYREEKAREFIKQLDDLFEYDKYSITSEEDF